MSSYLNRTITSHFLPSICEVRFGFTSVFARSIFIYSCASMKRKPDTDFKRRLKRSRRNMTTTKISLTPKEAQLRQLLLDVAQYIDESKQIKENIELRWAGGWVRDKLLDKPSHDIDTAINAMTGEDFAGKMQEYLKVEDNLKKHSLAVEDIRKIHKIAANPEKSKHLATATTNLFGLDLDFVNLRKETYSSESRNPQVEFGTVEEDALRRDATINALFYNLRSDEVEDFAGGLKDLAAKRISTPLDPKTTFMDDPLRVLRLIRFASRLSFDIDPETEKYMGDPDVLDALKLKISRERVGIEVEKMLKDKNPRLALQYFERLGLYSTIFTDPGSQDVPQPANANWSAVYDCLEQLRVNNTPGSIYYTLVRSQDAAYISWLLAALAPWAAVTHAESVKSKGKPSLPLGAMAAREGLKVETKNVNVIAGGFRHLQEIAELKEAIGRKEAYVNERDTVGMKIRGWDAKGGHWRLQCLFALLVEAMNRNDQDNYEKLFGEWQGLIEHLESIDVMDAPSEARIIDGKGLCKALGGIKPGIWMAPALDVIMAWQLRNPGVKDPAGAIEEVKSKHDELNIPM